MKWTSESNQRSGLLLEMRGFLRTSGLPPPALTATPERTAEILTAAAKRGETLTADQVGELERLAAMAVEILEDRRVRAGRLVQRAAAA